MVIRRVEEAVAGAPQVRRRRREAPRVPQRHSGSAASAMAAKPLLVVYIVLTILMGGASAYGSGLALVLLGITCLGLVYAAVTARGAGAVPLDRVSLALALTFLVYTALQLVPLPPAVWTALPGRGELASALQLAGAGEGAWLPLSADPARTFMSKLSALPVLLVLLLLARLDEIPVRTIALTYVVLALISMVVGILQVLGSGRDSPLYIHSFTNWGLAVGFFANANHLATLLLASLPLSAALLAQEPKIVSPKIRLWAFVFLAVVTAIAMYGTASVAGMILWFPAIFGGVALFGAGVGRKLLALIGLALAVAGAVGAWLWFSGALPTLVTTLGTSEGERLGMAQTGSEVARAYLPFGSGLGTFEHVYRPFEDSAVVTQKYVNHAHNDLLEWVIELGLFGAALAAALVGWWLRLSVRAWRSGSQWQRAASVATGLILAHSLVDYPLRTSAILVLFALSWAILCCSGRGEAAGGMAGEARAP